MQGSRLFAQTEVMVFPEMDTLESKSLQELRDLRLREVWWRKFGIFSIDTFGLELSDGQNCNVGQFIAKENFIFDGFDITRVEVQFETNEEQIKRIMFYERDRELVVLNK